MAWIVLVATAAAATALAPPANAVAGTPVQFTAFTSLAGDPDPFTGTIPGCAQGSVADGHAQLQFLPGGGVYIGDKLFACAGGQAGFTVRLKARFDASGSIGTWVISGSWGDLAGLKGSGSLSGINPDEGGLDDVYTGAIR
jgi:hypothetical protein